MDNIQKFRVVIGSSFQSQPLRTIENALTSYNLCAERPWLFAISLIKTGVCSSFSLNAQTREGKESDPNNASVVCRPTHCRRVGRHISKHKRNTRSPSDYKAHSSWNCDLLWSIFPVHPTEPTRIHSLVSESLTHLWALMYLATIL